MGNNYDPSTVLENICQMAEEFRLQPEDIVDDILAHSGDYKAEYIAVVRAIGENGYELKDRSYAETK